MHPRVSCISFAPARLSVHATLFIASLCAILSTGCAAHRSAAVAHAAMAPGIAADGRTAPILIANSVRESVPNDYMRVSFMPVSAAPVTTLARPGALRGFATATPLYQPPITLGEFPKFSGLENQDDNLLVAMRCRPSDPVKVDAILATWPSVFAAIPRDTKLDPAACTSNPTDPAIQMACYANDFHDQPDSKVPTALARTLDYAAALYDGKHDDQATWLQRNYGIYPAFAGTGYSVKDTYTLDASHPMTSQQMLVKSVSSEYVLKNVSLSDAGCRCISVAPYPGRANDPLDPDFIAQAGGDGSCKSVPRLQTVQH